jgi:hypothetical protein
MNSTKLLWGITVVTVGLMLIAANLGYISQTIWFDLLRLWPLILVFIGLKLIIKNEYLILLLGLITFVLGVSFVISNNENRWQYRVPFMPILRDSDYYEINQNFSEKLNKNEINKIDLSINTGAVRLQVKELPENSEDLYKIEAKNLFTLELDKDVNKNTYNLDLSEQTRRMMTMPRLSADRELTVYISRNVDLVLDLNNGASDFDLNFTNLNLTDLEVKAGASAGKIYFSDKVGQKNISLASGATDFELYFPKNVGLRIENTSGLSSVDISSEFSMSEKKDDISKSLNYDSSVSKYNIDIKSGVSSVKILTQ